MTELQWEIFCAISENWNVAFRASTFYRLLAQYGGPLYMRRETICPYSDFCKILEFDLSGFTSALLRPNYRTNVLKRRALRAKFKIILMQYGKKKITNYSLLGRLMSLEYMLRAAEDPKCNPYWTKRGPNVEALEREREAIEGVLFTPQ